MTRSCRPTPATSPRSRPTLAGSMSTAADDLEAAARRRPAGRWPRRWGRARSAGRGWGLSLRSCTTPEMNDADPQIILRWYRIPGVRRGRTLAAIAGLLLVPLGLARPAAQIARTVRIDPHCRPATPAIASTHASTSPRRTITADEVAHLAQHDVTRRRLPCSFTSTTTRGVTIARRGCASGGWRNPSGTTDVRPERLGLDRHLDRSQSSAAARTRDMTAAAALHRAGRRQRGRPDGGGGPARYAGRARRNDRGRDRLDGARAAHLRAHRRRSATSTSSRSGFRRSACCRTTAGTAISSTPRPSSSPTSASTTSG